MTTRDGNEEVRVSAVAEIIAPVAEVWRLVADLRHDVLWRTGVGWMRPERPGEVAEGDRAVEELTVLGTTMVTESIVTSVEPGRRFTWRSTSGMEVSGTRSVIALGPDATLAEFDLRLRPRHDADRAQLPMFTAALDRIWTGDMARLSIAHDLLSRWR